MESRLEEIEARYEAVLKEMESPDVSANPTRLRELGKALSELEDVVRPYRDYRVAVRDGEDARELAKAEPDPQMAAAFREEAERSEKRAAELRAELELLLVPKDPNDGKDVILEVRAGAGGQEAALWAGEVFEMYRRYAERRKWKSEVLTVDEAEIGGLKDAALSVKGGDAYSRLKHESGVHRVQRVPVTESSGRIHTSTATVAVMPEAAEIEIEIRPEDIELQVYRSQGPGGQSVNTTDSAVRITHKPSGIVVTCQEERSQLQNREKAMRYLRARLLARAQQEAQQKEAATRRSQVGTGERSEKIRTYNFAEGRVTDHRIKQTVHRLHDVLGGDLDEFVDALLSAERAEQLAEG
ncbi:MAG TPA: peptide chain release factor 1 [Actinomycetota bacterium]|jgi:peptide chain release factor 1|nr:peptide chain release factor 1 [Actinomycetota bacterium]